MSLKVLHPGLLTTLQDLGRYGFQKQGVIVSGAMDPFSLRIANLLVGNKEEEAGLEITMRGPTLLIQKNMLISICGGNLSPKIDGRSIEQWRPIDVKAGSMLEFGRCISGCRTYLAAAGGLDVTEVMGSKSTYLRAGIGGFQGRALKENDVVKINQPDSEVMNHAAKWFVSTTIIPRYDSNPIIRVIRGREMKRFSDESIKTFFSSEFQVTPQSDRMGYRLIGKNLKLSQPFEMISEAVSFGTIQVPPDGNPIILLADRQTTGGYPKIAQIISVDLPIIGQMQPAEKMRFKEVTIEEAQRLYIQREQAIQQLKQGISLKNL